VRGLILLLACTGPEAEDSQVTLDTGPATCDEEGDIFKLFPRLLEADCQWDIACTEVVQGDPDPYYDCVNSSHIGPRLHSESVWCVDWCLARGMVAESAGPLDCAGSTARPQYSDVFYLCEERNF